MDFELPAEIESLCARVRDFVDAYIIPLESKPDCYDAHENIAQAPLERVRAAAKAAGLWAPQIASEYGGLGLSYVGLAAV
jgi:acyl-CoA dehydrogenase